MLRGIDHVLVAVQDLERASQVYQQLGFQVLPGGKHPSLGTHNALVPLADGFYLELIAVWDRELAERQVPFVVSALARDNRLARFVLESDDLDADVAAMRARGFEISDPTQGERERPDGQRVAWKAAFPRDWRLPFIIQDITPRELRVPAPTFGIGQQLRLADVRVGVRDLAAASALFQQLLGVEGEEGWFHLERGDIVLRDVDTEQLLQLTLDADEPLRIAEDWSTNGVDFDQSIVAGMGVTLQPVETQGAPLVISGRLQ